MIAEAGPADRGPVAHQMFPGKRQGMMMNASGPGAGRKSVTGRDMAGREPADDGVAGPARRGDREQQIGLGWRSSFPAGGILTWVSEADIFIHSVFERSGTPVRVKENAFKQENPVSWRRGPARRGWPGRNDSPGTRPQNTDFGRLHQWGRWHRDHAQAGGGGRPLRHLAVSGFAREGANMQFKGDSAAVHQPVFFWRQTGGAGIKRNN